MKENSEVLLLNVSLTAVFQCWCALVTNRGGDIFLLQATLKHTFEQQRHEGDDRWLQLGHSQSIRPVVS